MRIALIAGASGAVGTALARCLSASDQWSVVGIARRKPATPINGVHYAALDLSDLEGLREGLARLPNPTHLFYCGRATHAEQVIENTSQNLKLLDHLVTAVEAKSPDLQHVHLVQGGKYYGVHIGPFQTPARESDPRAPIRNFNYDQQDYLAERSAHAPWQWSASRPNTLLHYSPGNGRNLISSLGVYAAFCKSLGAALDFPGPEGAYRGVTQLTTLSQLARAIAWMASEPRCANQAFNVTNTDLIRWERIWPRLAKAFEMPLGVVRPMRLADVMADREVHWQDQFYATGQPHTNALNDLVNWGYLDATLERYWDEILCHNKIRAFGFDPWDNSEERLFSLLTAYRDARILPN